MDLKLGHYTKDGIEVIDVGGEIDIYTAPRWGYTDALDYYRQASAAPWIPAIRVPTFILTARDDPFVAVEPFEMVAAPSTVEIHISACGGHLGFIAARGIDPDHRWLDWRIVDWVLSHSAPARPTTPDATQRT